MAGEVSNKSTKLWVGFLVTHALLISVFAAFRFVDWDEGFYLQAGRSVASGLRLYFDFFHPQAPIYPQLLSYLTDGGWDALFQARAINVALSVLTMALVALSARKLLQIARPDSDSTDKYSSLLLALFLCCFSGLFLSWNSAAKPLALSQFFLVTGLALRLFASKRNLFSAILLLAFSGAAFSFAAQTRSPLLVALPIIVLHLLFAEDIRHKALSALAFLTGAHFAALPTLTALAHDWRTMLYNNIGFHLSRTDAPSLSAVIIDKLWTTAKLLLDPQILLLFILLGSALWLGRSGRRYLDWLKKTDLLYALLGLVILAVYFRAHPSLRQYAVQALPILIIVVSASAPVIFKWLTERFANRTKAVVIVGLSIYALGAIPYFYLYDIAPREYDRKGLQSRMEAVVSEIQSRSAPADVILAESAIYPVLSKRTPLPRTEFVGFQYKSLNLGDKYGMMNLPDTSYLYREINAQTPVLVVIDFEPDSALAIRLNKNYDLVFSDDYAELYQRKSESPK